jgi:hypothetical protein
MTATLYKAATLVGVYLMVLLASVLTGMVYTGQVNPAQWTQEMRTMIAGAPLTIVVIMLFLGII